MLAQAEGQVLLLQELEQKRLLLVRKLQAQEALKLPLLVVPEQQAPSQEQLKQLFPRPEPLRQEPTVEPEPVSELDRILGLHPQQSSFPS